jgi:selenocysteine lyase/cysteine desulfurase
VRLVPLAELAESVGPATAVVACSLAQSSDGRLVEVPRLLAAARAHGAMTVCDTTQAVGWLPVAAEQFDVTACAAYKWLACPRGAAFATVSPAARDRLRPVSAGWYAGRARWDSIYGPRMELADDARRFDVSPAWLAWVGAAPALELFAATDPEALRAHGVGLAARFRRAVDLPPAESPVVSLADPDGGRADRLRAAGCSFATRAGRIRLAFHIWNDQDDADRAAAASRDAG